MEGVEPCCLTLLSPHNSVILSHGPRSYIPSSPPLYHERMENAVISIRMMITEGRIENLRRASSPNLNSKLRGDLTSYCYIQVKKTPT